MNRLVKVYFIEGDYLGDKVFKGEPLVGDCFLMWVDMKDLEADNYLVYINSRRWTDGNLELTVGFDAP